MFKRWMLQNGLGDTGDAGGGNGGLGDDKGAAGDNTGGAGGDPGAGAGGAAGEFVGPAWAKDLKLSVEKEILQDPALGPISDLNSLVKSYVHAQRKIGQKGVLIPTENSTKEEWDTFYQKIGVPIEESKYTESVKFGEDALDKEFNKEFAKVAHELRIPPKQAEKLHKFFADKTKVSSERFVETTQAQMEAELNALQAKIGPDAYGVKLNKANMFLKEHAGAEFMTYLKESGLGKNAKIVEGIMNIAERIMKEDALPTGGDAGGEDYQKNINQLYSPESLKTDAYFKADHPDHKRRVQEVNGWYAKLEKRK